jgi:hypothetical protein
MHGFDVYISTFIKSALLCGCYFPEPFTPEDENM